MALQSSGVQISASDIRTEFGPSGDFGAFGFPSANTSVSVGNYRISKSYGGMNSMPLDQGVPQAGAIRFSDFYAKRLNIISDLWRPINNNTTRRNGRSQYNSGEVDVLGWRSKPSSSSGCKVFIHVNQTIGSATGGDCTCAVRTGSWDTDTRLETNVGSGGRIFGAGGRGGNGGIPGGVGSDGTSGLGVEYDPSAVVNNGYIQAGYGGGGGGGRSAVDPSDKNDYDPTAGGGGGGGGAGFPIGQGGSGGSGTFPGSNGNNSSQTTAGVGGAGGSGDGTDAGDGGRGGDLSAAPQRGGDGNESYGGAFETVGGNPGLSGDAVRVVTGTAATPDTESTETFSWTRTNTDQYPFAFFVKSGSNTGPDNFTIGIATGTSSGVGDVDANFRLTSGAFGPSSSGYPDPIEGQATNDSYVKLDLTGTGTATLNFAWTWNDQIRQDGRACDFVEVFLTSPTGGSVSSTYEKFTMTWNQQTGSSNASVTVVKPNAGTHELTVKLTGTYHTFDEDDDGDWTDTVDEYDNQTDPNNPNSWTPGQLYNEDDEPEGTYKSERYLHGILTGVPAGLANTKTLGIHDMDGDDNNAALTVSVVNTTTSGTGAMSGTFPATVAPSTVYVGQAGNSTGFSVNSTNPRQLTIQGQGTGASSDDLVVNVTSGTFAEAGTQISWTAPSTGQGTPSSGTTSGVSITNNGTITGDIEYGVNVC